MESNCLRYPQCRCAHSFSTAQISIKASFSIKKRKMSSVVNRCLAFHLTSSTMPTGLIRVSLIGCYCCLIFKLSRTSNGSRDGYTKHGFGFQTLKWEKEGVLREMDLRRRERGIQEWVKTWPDPRWIQLPFLPGSSCQHVTQNGRNSWIFGDLFGLGTNLISSDSWVWVSWVSPGY